MSAVVVAVGKDELGSYILGNDDRRLHREEALLLRVCVAAVGGQKQLPLVSYQALYAWSSWKDARERILDEACRRALRGQLLEVRNHFLHVLVRLDRFGMAW